jgi:hypothetical protein
MSVYIHSVKSLNRTFHEAQMQLWKAADCIKSWNLTYVIPDYDLQGFVP